MYNCLSESYAALGRKVLERNTLGAEIYRENIHLSYFPSPRKITLRFNSFTYFIHEQSTASLSLSLFKENRQKFFRRLCTYKMYELLLSNGFTNNMTYNSPYLVT